MAYPMKPLYCRRCRNLLGETNGVRLTSKRKKRAFDIEGECEVTAGDIKPDSEVDILDPGMHIATLGKDAKLYMEIPRAR